MIHTLYCCKFHWPIWVYYRIRFAIQKGFMQTGCLMHQLFDCINSIAPALLVVVRFRIKFEIASNFEYNWHSSHSRSDCKECTAIAVPIHIYWRVRLLWQCNSKDICCSINWLSNWLSNCMSTVIIAQLNLVNSQTEPLSQYNSIRA